MNFIFTGLLASFLAFISNRYLVSRIGNQAIVYIIPILEESLKTVSCYIFGANLILVHLIFGIIEGIFDYFNNKIAALLAVLSHLLFAYITLTLWNLSNIVLAILITSLIHIGWNYLIGRLML
ncbi:hypothetical protein BX659_12087 [Orenia metallireducens]|jgi:hypothetical protein|uniref:CAAX protease self-immunity n=1 Tax=Orenia metallireducens TaxID=1413210 RepID=A0A285GZP6_9FIRM|nr:hypothetical protein [Orenia metallireducens]PRX26496.1 hypothetical protein BX659_12087 [Orenia metallireducens]SNY28977.1 hypothetical protein SAMN06265827_11287 [Orenia metallireducens]